MNEIEVRTMNFEPLVRKRIASFVERILQCLGYDFRHEIFKGIVYAEVEVKTSTEAWIKNCYDAFLYLISNYKNPCSEELLNKFFYILKGKEVSNMITARISFKIFLVTRFAYFRTSNRITQYCLSKNYLNLKKAKKL